MAYVLGLLVLALIVKDATPIGDTYILRGIAEGLALIVGVVWFLTHSHLEIYKKYRLIFGYLIVLFLTIISSRQPIYVALQVISLAAVLLFFIAYLESSSDDVSKNEIIMKIVLMVFIVVCLASLILYAFWPSLVSEMTLEGRRFKGLFGKPAKMAATAGLLLGLCVFREQNIILRVLGVFVSLPCLYLTGSRTFWAAAAAGLLVTSIFYLKRKLEWGLAVVMAASFSLIVMIVADISISSKAQSRILRGDSIERLSGRTLIWHIAFEKFLDRPLLGYGFTVGSDAFKEWAETEGNNPNQLPQLLRRESFTMHSGYVQALLDSGLLGVIFYISIMISVLWRLVRYDRARRYGAEMFSLTFLTISNFGESVVLSAAVFHAVFYWYLATFAHTLRSSNETVHEDPPVDSIMEMSIIGSSKREYDLLKTIQS